MTSLVHPYFLLKAVEHNVTLIPFTACPSGPHKIPFARMYEIDKGMDAQILMAIFISFLSY